MLSESYTQKPGSIPDYFEAMLNAQPPERFSTKFIENLGFKSTNDRLFMGILKDLGFLNRDGAPQQRYFEFLDRSKSKHTVAEGLREAFSDLFALNTRANEMTVEDVKNKLRTLFAGKKTELTIDRIAKTFKALAEFGDFRPSSSEPNISGTEDVPTHTLPILPKDDKENGDQSGTPEVIKNPPGQIKVSGLQYHINIVLPDTRDQSVYDAIFKSLREHLG